MATREGPAAAGEDGESPAPEGELRTAPAGTDLSHRPTETDARRRAIGHPAGATIGHYEVIRPLGHGGMGEVYLARDTRLGRRVALKFLLEVDAPRGARFLAEARATARLAHENIVALYDVAEHQGSPYMVLEYVPGKTLAAWLRERRKDGAAGRGAGVPPSRAAELMLPVARALRCAHEAGIAHRDLKPDNIMLADSGAVKVLDLGIAKLLTEAEGPARAPGDLVRASAAGDSATSPDAIMGTLEYMSPEQWGADLVDERTDLWAMGVVLFEMVTGEHPLAPLSLGSLASVTVLDEPMPSVRERLPGIGRLGAVIDRCLVKRKADRLGSAQELIAELTGVARPGPGAAHGPVEEGNPYAGLSAFQERDAARFFGRERAVEQVVARLGEQPLLAVIGPSGAGKSSLVRAGVIPALKRGGDAWEAFVVRPGPRPLAALAELLLQPSWSGARTGAPSPADRDAWCERLRREPGLVGAEMRARAQRRIERILLFVDQFEELVTLAPEDERAAFLACLTGAADDPSSPLRVIVSVRQDFLDRVAGSHAELSERMSRGTVLVGPMSASDLRSALTKPAELSGYRFESEALVDAMLAELSGVSGALPLLQFTASRLWEARDQERRLLTGASYHAFGGVGGALATHADSVLGGLGQQERRWARVLLLRLVTPERTRALVTPRDLAELAGAAPAELDRVLGRLIDARLCTAEGVGREESTVELVHESLIAAWPALVRWLDEEQDDAQLRARLRGAAKEWEASGGAEGLLWRGEAAEEARRWRERRGPEGGAELAAREARYLAAVVALEERERRRRRRVVGALFAGLSLVVLLVSALAVRSNREATRAEAEKAEAQLQRAEAERSAASARNATRMAAARERQGDPTTVLALLREIEPGAAPRGWSELARWAWGAGVAPVVLLHEDKVRSAAWSPDGRRIVSASADRTVRVWSADGSGEPLVLRGHEDGVRSAVWSPDGRRIVSASADRTVRVWSADGSGEPLVLRGHDDGVRSAAWSPDGRRIVSASADRTVRVWSADGSGEPLVLRGHDGVVMSAAWSPDGQRIASASYDKTVRVWSPDAGGASRPLVLQGHDAYVYAAAWSPDGQRIVSASEDRTLRVWSANAGGAAPLLVLRGHDASVVAAAWSPDGRRIVSASLDKTVRVWSADGAGQPLVLQGHDGVVSAAAWSPDSQRIVSASEDRTARVWKAGGSGQPLVLQGHDEPVYAAAFSPDGRRIASASWDRTVRVWSADGSGQPLVLRGHGDRVEAASWSPDGQRIVSVSYDKTVRVWSADGSGEPLVLQGHDGVVRSAAFSPDGRRIVSASWDKTVRVWNADGTGQPLVLRGHDDVVSAAAWSPDGRRIASTSSDKTVRVWNADGSGQPLVLRGHDAGVYGVAWSPDGRRIVSASRDKTVRVWNADGSGQPLVLRGHDAVVSSAAWSPDGQRIVSSSDDGTVRVWRAAGGGEPLVLRASKEAINAASWSPDGRRIVAASDDRTVIVWSDIEPLSTPDDPRLWLPTRYCMPLEVRRHLLDFSEEQSRADLDRCQRHVFATGPDGGSRPQTPGP